MYRLAALLLLIVLVLAAVPLAAQRVDATNTHYRVVTIDRVVTGPPAPGQRAGARIPAHAADPGILGWVAVYSQSGEWALVEYVFEKPADMAALRADAAKDARLHVADKARMNTTKRNAFETAAKAAGFTSADLEKFAARILRVP